MTQSKQIKVFDYIEELDAFVINTEFKNIANHIGLTEWHAAVDLGRLFCMDNDFGEHWLDNWSLKEVKQDKAAQLGINPADLIVIDPERFQDGKDGPCHTSEIRRQFWHSVLNSLKLDSELLFELAREINDKLKYNFQSEKE